MALNERQKIRLEKLLDTMTEEEVDTVLTNMHNFVDFIYYKARDIYNAIKDTIGAVWQWIKSIFS